ncbi:Bax inhibitor-1/YccA family protein [Ruminococcus sp.]|uniref:Bax inhibitor-1/YccA family membrane protein n=1 Tax=Ruminococcus sp. TaxID=41978 RepID=UPI003867AD12
MARLSSNNNTATKERRSFLSSNPVMHRLDKVNEFSETDSATYGGIAAKTVYFLLFSVVGIAVERVLSQMLSTGQTFDLNIKGFHVSLYMGEVIALFASVILAIVFQLLAFFAKPTTPVTGALYCVTQGYMISFTVFKVLHGFEYLGLLALAITMTIVLVMAILYATGLIRVTKKFRMVMMTLFITVIAVSLLMLVGSFIPATSEMVMQIRNNFAVSIGFSVVFIIIASLFLICDFATIDHVVQDRLPKKYEWQAAFGLSFTVLWLYLKVLDLIMTIAGNKNNN